MIHFHCVSHQHGEYRSRVIIVILLTIIDLSISKKVFESIKRAEENLSWQISLRFLCSSY
ncbi:hypothetical protein ABFA07_011221 [Porites harrisoni]